MPPSGTLDSFLQPEGFLYRARRVARRQPYVLDEELDELFTRTISLAPKERVHVYRLLWIAVEAIDRRWKPDAAFIGTSTYTPPGDQGVEEALKG